MHWLNAFVLYVMIWWTVLFAVLPFGTRPVAEPDQHTGWRGAPERPRIGIKLLATTLIATALFGLALFVMDRGWISFRPTAP